MCAAAAITTPHLVLLGQQIDGLSRRGGSTCVRGSMMFLTVSAPCSSRYRSTYRSALLKVSAGPTVGAGIRSNIPSLQRIMADKVMGSPSRFFTVAMSTSCEIVTPGEFEHHVDSARNGRRPPISAPGCYGVPRAPLRRLPLRRCATVKDGLGVFDSVLIAAQHYIGQCINDDEASANFPDEFIQGRQ